MHKPMCSLNCSCSSFFLCTRALKTMLIQQYTSLLCKPVIMFAINIVLQNLFAEIMYSNFTQIQIVHSLEKTSSECSDSSFEICLCACRHLHNCSLSLHSCGTDLLHWCNLHFTHTGIASCWFSKFTACV